MWTRLLSATAFSVRGAGTYVSNLASDPMQKDGNGFISKLGLGILLIPMMMDGSVLAYRVD